jgi:hypothetical protein
MITLGSPKYFKLILDIISIDVLEFKELQKGEEIFQSYGNFLRELDHRKRDKANPINEMEELRTFLLNLEEGKALNNYMTELSDKFNSDLFVRRLISKK